MEPLTRQLTHIGLDRAGFVHTRTLHAIGEKLLVQLFATTLIFGVSSMNLSVTPPPQISPPQSVNTQSRTEGESLRECSLWLESMSRKTSAGQTIVTASAATSAPSEVVTVPITPADEVSLTGISKVVCVRPETVTDVESADDPPEQTASNSNQSISFTGLLDTYLTYNTNDPNNGQNTLYYTNPSSRGFGLNQVKLEIDASSGGPIGFRSDIWFGSGARLFRDGLEPGPLEDVINLQQAHGYYKFGNGAELAVGLFGTIAGLEVPESHLNWNYTRGILWAWNEPFSHVGAKVRVPLSDAFSATFMLVNGFDNAFDQNSGKSYGVQGSFAPSDRFSTTLTWIHGPENDLTNDGWLKNLSWNAYGRLHDRFEGAVNLDYVQADDPAGVSSTSWGMGGYTRVHLSDQVRIANRFEFLNDQEARSTGIEQTLKEYTFTFEVQPVKDNPRFLTRFEYRRDWSDVAFFGCTGCGASGLKTNQNTFTIGMMWRFGKV